VDGNNSPTPSTSRASPQVTPRTTRKWAGKLKSTCLPGIHWVSGWGLAVESALTPVAVAAQPPVAVRLVGADRPAAVVTAATRRCHL
jgi:hypothetical protein